MWEITDKFTGELPPEFRVKESPDFAYLFYKETLVAVFSASGATAEAISQAAKEYLNQIDH